MKKQVSPVVTVIVILVVVVIVALIWSYLGQGGHRLGGTRVEGGGRGPHAQATVAERDKATKEAMEMSRAAAERLAVQKAAAAPKKSPSPAPAGETGGE